MQFGMDSRERLEGHLPTLIGNIRAGVDDIKDDDMAVNWVISPELGI